MAWSHGNSGLAEATERSLGRYRGGVVALLLLCLAGCGPDPVGDTTRWTVADVEAMTAEMAQSLLASPALAERGPDSEPWLVSMGKVLNLSDEVMTVNEQWSVLAQVRGAAPIAALSEDKAVRFVLPPERVAALREHDDATDFGPGFGAQRRVTHTMAATFRSVTRAQATRRSDLYYCEFELLDLRTAEPVWSGRFEFKRQAKGHVWD